MADARLSQLPVEVLHAAIVVDARLSQLPVEVLHAAPPPTAAQVSQVPVEVLVLDLPLPPVRVSHSPLEVLTQGDASLVAGRVSQAAVELLQQTAASHVAARLSQASVEIVYPFGCYTPFAPCLDVYPILPTCTADLYPVLPSEACMDASTFITNMALQEIGISKTLGNLATDVSQEAYCARLIFTDVVDTVLRDHPWKFATEYAALVWLAGSLETPVNPDWTYTYHLPDDCVRVRRVCEPVMQRRYTVTPIPFDQRADADGIKDILMCNEPGAGQLEAVDPPTITIEYTKRFACPGQVNDAQFRECLVMKMAARLAKALARDSKDADRALRNYTLALPKAQTQHANSQEVQRPTSAPPDWIEGR